MEEQVQKEDELVKLQEENIRLKDKIDNMLPRRIAALEVVRNLKKYKRTLYLSVAGLFVTVIAAIFGMRMANWPEIYRVLPSAVLCGVFAVSFSMSIFKVKQQQDYLEEQYDLKEKKKDEDEF